MIGKKNSGRLFEQFPHVCIVRGNNERVNNQFVSEKVYNINGYLERSLYDRSLYDKCGSCY